jgi:hypothetical protein
MPGTADKFTQSAQGRLLRLGMTSFATRVLERSDQAFAFLTVFLAGAASAAFRIDLA